MRTLRMVYAVFARAIAFFAMFFTIAIVALRVAAPWPASGELSDEAQDYVAIALQSDFYNRKHPVFLSFDGIDPSEERLKRLRSATPSIDIQRMSERPSSHSTCRNLPIQFVPLNRCEKDDFVRIDFLSMPFWRSVLLRETTAACSGEVLLVKVASKWYVFSSRRICA
jgi:hypothetical protein